MKMGIKSTQIGVCTMSEPEVLEPRFPQQVWFLFLVFLRDCGHRRSPGLELLLRVCGEEGRGKCGVKHPTPEQVFLHRERFKSYPKTSEGKRIRSFFALVAIIGSGPRQNH